MYIAFLLSTTDTHGHESLSPILSFWYTFSLRIKKGQYKVKDSNGAIRFPKRKCAFICTTILSYAEDSVPPRTCNWYTTLKELESGTVFIVSVLGAVVKTE